VRRILFGSHPGWAGKIRATIDTTVHDLEGRRRPIDRSVPAGNGAVVPRMTRAAIDAGRIGGKPIHRGPIPEQNRAMS
jgi:hypothetical protein